jgi:hypothetical protein
MSPSAEAHRRVSAEPALPEAVRQVIQTLSGDRPLAAAGECLDAGVVIHVDGGEVHRGLGLWKRWVHLMRERGRLRGLRFEPASVEAVGDRVRVVFRWSGERRRGGDPRRPVAVNVVEYRVEGSRVAEIWTRKANYVDVFGAWIRVTPLYRLFLLWGVGYFLIRRDPEFRLAP